MTAFYSGDPYWTLNVTNYVTTFRHQLLQAPLLYRSQISIQNTGASVYKNTLNRDNVLPKQPQHATLPREYQQIRRTLHGHTVARHTRKIVDLKHILTPTTIRQSRGVNLLMVGLLHALKGQGLPCIVRRSHQRTDRPPCCTNNTAPILHLLPATINLRNNAHLINVLIHAGSLQANIISANIAKLLATDGGLIFGTNIVLTFKYL